MMANNGRLTGRGWALLPAGPHHQPGGVLLHAGACLGLLLIVVLIPAF
jgi:hypothetical protein